MFLNLILFVLALVGAWFSIGEGYSGWIAAVFGLIGGLFLKDVVSNIKTLLEQGEDLD